MLRSLLRPILDSRLVLSSLAAALLSALVLLPGFVSADPPAAVTGDDAPRWSADGSLERPKDWERWVFVGSSLGLSYAEQTRDLPPEQLHLHHVYLAPSAYEHFARTGEFPEGTQLVLELYRLSEPVAPSKRGYFAGERIAVEVALKDSRRFEPGWAYFDFSEGRETSTPFPAERCASCHHEHAATDNVFTQFYPVLRRVQPVAAHPPAAAQGQGETTRNSGG